MEEKRLEKKVKKSSVRIPFLRKRKIDSGMRDYGLAVSWDSRLNMTLGETYRSVFKKEN